MRANFVSKMKYPISLVVITLNEEANLARCLSSVTFVDEIVVVDSGSTDKTVEIAESFGARVIKEPWQGYARQKILAVSHSKNKWVLSLDGDEALSPELNLFLSKKLASGTSDFLAIDAYSFPRKNWYMGKWMKYSGMYPDMQTRLFNKERANWTESNVHEHVVAKKTLKINVPILHWSFQSISHQIETINKYSSLRALDFKEKGKRFSFCKLFFKPISKFFETYILKLGFLDGVQGLLVSFVSSFATFLRWAKLYEIERDSTSSQL